MDLTGRHITKGGADIYGLVCVCLQTYNTRIYRVESRKLESISLAIEVLVQEVGPPDFIACDKEGFSAIFKNIGQRRNRKTRGEASNKIQICGTRCSFYNWLSRTKDADDPRFFWENLICKGQD